MQPQPVDEFRVRLTLDETTVCTITSSDLNNLKQHISTLFDNKATFEQRDGRQVEVKYRDVDGNQHIVWIAAYKQIPEESVPTLTQLKKQAAREKVA
jgi:hypothetical protein